VKQDSESWTSWALLTASRGFLFGLGFSIAIGGAYAVVWHWYLDPVERAVVQGNQEAPADDLALADVEEEKHDGVTLIIGNVKNNGATPARFVEVQADLFDHGKFVDQYSTSLSGALAAGEMRNFKISCGCKDTPPAEHDSFKTQVVSRY